jgi:hypothetical protein
MGVSSLFVILVCLRALNTIARKPEHDKAIRLGNQGFAEAGPEGKSGLEPQARDRHCEDIATLQRPERAR